MDPSINSTLSAIAEKAPQIAELARAREAAISAERDAEAAILERAIDLVRPALEALCGRIPISFREQVGSPRPADYGYSAEYRGFCLVDGFARDTSCIDGGLYYGERLYLLADSSLLALRREGHWSEEDEGLCEWEVVDQRPLSPREVMDEYTLAECLEPMWAALDRPVKSYVEPLRKAQERAERLRAILTLL